MPETQRGGDRWLPAATLDALHEPIVLVDAGASVVLFNRAAAETWPALTVGRPVSLALRNPVVLDALADVLRGAPERVGELAERVPVERIFALQVTALPGTGHASGPTPAALLAFRDQTEARRLEAMRVDFVANASHELRTPLASLLGFIETLEGPARDDASARDRFLKIMREQARRMARLIDDLLSLSRVELREHRQPEGEVDLVAVVRQIVDMLRPLALEQGVEMRVSATHELVIPGDRDELARVVENLIENALKYGGSGKLVEVGVAREDTLPARSAEAVLTVRDHGPGIEPRHLPRLTERFYRAGGTSSGGTGLGLAIVKHIVNRHRGRMSIESELGRGATFRVMLPLQR
jgi:two-component system phosphate regulon sensor histidine kinase PhoR